MYKEHPVFIQPKNEKIKVWKYMDLSKFVSLIDSQSLFFTRADKFDDIFEGSWPKANVDNRKYVPKNVPPEQHERLLKEREELDKIYPHLPKYTAINCWHMNDHESAAMWRLYLKSDEGVAIQSTYSKLKNSLIDNEEIYLGKVKYIDYSQDKIDRNSLYAPFVYKRKSFEHEHEVRGLVQKTPFFPADDNGSSIVPIDYTATETIVGYGLSIKVDIETLIEHVYIAPGTPAWFKEMIDAVTNRYGYKFKVEQSKIDESPIF